MDQGADGQEYEAPRLNTETVDSLSPLSLGVRVDVGTECALRGRELAVALVKGLLPAGRSWVSFQVCYDASSSVVSVPRVLYSN